MEKKERKQQDKKPVPKEVGSNLTGTALKGKPGHQRDIDTKIFEAAGETKAPSTEPIGNTDALLGDVHPTHRSPKSQEQHNADKES
jgi:hypothetical protein